MVGMAFAGTFDDAFEKCLVTGYSKSRLTQLIVCDFARFLGIATADLSNLFISFRHIL